MKEVRVRAYKFEGYAVTVELEGNIQEYAESFLHIFNNVKENKELLKVENYYNNDVTVYCELEVKEQLIDYLGKFGKVKGCEKVLIYQVEEPNWDIDKYYDIVLASGFNI